LIDYILFGVINYFYNKIYRQICVLHQSNGTFALFDGLSKCPFRLTM